MKRIITLFVAFALLVSLFGFSGCSKSADQPPTETSTAEAPANEPEEVITLTFSSNTNDGTSETKCIEEWIAKVEEETGGRLQFDLYLSGALVSESDIVDAVKSGLCDVGYVGWAKQTNALPLSTTLLAPFGNPGNGRTFYQNVFKPLWEQFPELQEEYDGSVLVGLGMNTYGAGLDTNKPVYVPSDCEGLLISAQTSSQSDLTMLTGASPLTLEASEWYSSLERGLCDGIWMTWGAFIGIGLYEVAECTTVFPSGYDRPITCFLMNEDTFNDLPEDIQEYLTSDEMMNWFADIWATYDEENFAKVEQVLTDAGNTIIYLEPEQEQEWIDLADGVRQTYLQTYEDIGLPAFDFYAAYEELAANNQT